MKEMNIYELKSSLLKVFEEWTGETGSKTMGFANLDLTIGKDTVNHLTDIVISTLLAMAESQKYKEEN